MPKVLFVCTRLQWFFSDPSTFTGTDAEIMNRVREVRDAIREKGVKDGQ